MEIFAVIDTNVIVSAMLSKNSDSSVIKVLNAVLSKRIVPMYNPEILSEYREVLARKKFRLPPLLVSSVIDQIEKQGVSSERICSNEYFPDSDDRVFYEVALSKDDAYLVTGNARHFPKTRVVVSPSEMLDILENSHR